jgi:hypothetical protein
MASGLDAVVAAALIAAKPHDIDVVNTEPPSPNASSRGRNLVQLRPVT